MFNGLPHFVRNDKGGIGMAGGLKIFLLFGEKFAMMALVQAAMVELVDTQA